MRRQSGYVIGIMVLLVLVLGAQATAGPGDSVHLLGESDNLLANEGFEGEFAGRHDPYTGIWANELGVAVGWEPWYDNVGGCPPHEPDCGYPDSYNHRPEFKREEIGDPPVRIRSGDASQKMFTTYSTHTAGSYQVIDTPPNTWARFSIWAIVWSSRHDDPEYSLAPGYYGVSVGIDPTGGDRWDSADIQWSVPITRHDQWLYLELAAYSESGHVSVWTRGHQMDPVKHNDSYWDDAELIVLDTPPEPTPTVTPTRTPHPTPGATPPGYQPPVCDDWATWLHDGFAAADLERWGWDEGAGEIRVAEGLLRLANGGEAIRAFPVVWLATPWPRIGDVRISLRFAFPEQSGYGTSIGIGSEPYAGDRILYGTSPPFGLGNILDIHHNSPSPGSGKYEITLLGESAWVGTPGDGTWHTLSLELRERTFVLAVDGTERARAVSYWRPQSLHVGNAIVVLHKGTWTEVALDEILIETCGAEKAFLPYIVRGDLALVPTVPVLPPMTRRAHQSHPTATPLPSVPRLPLLLRDR